MNSRSFMATVVAMATLLVSVASSARGDAAPEVGRIYKLTGPAFVGNRLVLRAKTYGDSAGATFAWKRNGVTVATTERLDIPALTASDFGTYTFTMTNPHGTATTEDFVLAEAPAGVPVGWGASDHGRTTTPEGLSNVAQIASGMNFNLALKTDGTVAAWGYNGHGGCDAPAGLSGVSFVAAGGYESQGAGFAVKTDGSVVAWGTPMEEETYWDDWADWDEYAYWDDYAYEEWNDDKGEWEWVGDWVGDWVGGWVTYTNGYDTVSTMPASLSDVVKVAVGGECAIALKADGSVVSWGASYEYGYWENLYDDDGNWTNDVYIAERFDYTPPAGLSDVVDVAAGAAFLMALKSDGTVAVWNDGDDWYGECDVPEGLDEVVAIAAGKADWSGRTCFALRADGTVVKWGDEYGDYEDAPVDGVVAIDAGQYHAMALDDAGYVTVWGYTWYRQDDVPEAVQGNAVGIAAGGYHCTAILPDADGDTIADAEEVLLGRDPAVYEDYRRLTVSGRISISGVGPASNADVTLFDAAGEVRAAAYADEDGVYSLPGLIPGFYFVRIKADGAVDIWLGDLFPTFDEQAPFSVFGGDRDDADFDLAPGQGQALVQVSVFSMTDDGDGEYMLTDPPPTSTAVYLDMWPVNDVTNAAYHGLIDIGEVAASHANGRLLPHQVALRPATPATPSPAEIVGVEGQTVYVDFPRDFETGAVKIVTEPAGAEVWIDYADESVGVTPLTVGNLAAASHTLLLRKEGYLRPRPIHFSVKAGGETEISVPLAEETEPEMSVSVDSAIPGIPIYLDYLPTGATTPSLVRGMDPASHAGAGWFSREHSILLRLSLMSPFAPRIVPAPEEGASYPTKLFIDAPNTYEDSDGDGIRNDAEVAGGSDTFAAPGASTVTLDNGAGVDGAMIIVKTGETPAPIGVPIRFNYVFNGYYDAAGGDGTQYFDATGAATRAWDKADASVTLYPRWTWNPVIVKYMNNGGEGTMADTTFSAGSDVSLTANSFTRFQRDFAGWGYAADGAVVYADKWTGALLNEFGQVPVAGETVTLFAIWKTATYTATFDAAGGTGGASMTLAAGAALVAPQVARPGYVFAGWLPAVPAAMPAGNAVYVAQWTPTTYTVKFNANGGKLPKKKKMAAQTFTYDSASQLRKNVFTREGWVFAGWAVSKADAKKGVIAYTNAQSVGNVRADGGTTTLYAVWAKKTYKVAFQANGGKGAMSVESFTYGKAKKLSANKFKAPKGKKFAGWAKSKSDAKKGVVAYKNKAKVKNLIITGKTVKLYAVWKKK